MHQIAKRGSVQLKKSGEPVLIAQKAKRTTPEKPTENGNGHAVSAKLNGHQNGKHPSTVLATSSNG